MDIWGTEDAAPSVIIDAMKRIAVIGGGAAGLACAVAAASSCCALGREAQIVLFERDERVGRTILATGNGRCNFSNSHLELGEYRNAEFVARVLASLEAALRERSEFAWLSNAVDPKQDASASPCGENKGDALRLLDAVHRFFALLGLAWREERDGRQYPLANKASSVLDVLRFAIDRLGVQVRCDTAIAEIDPPRKPGAPYTLRTQEGVFERVDAVVVAVGGRACAKLRIADLPKPRLRPVLGPLATDVALIKELNNIRVRASVSLIRFVDGCRQEIAVEPGEIMFRKYGVSGIAAFNLSRYAQPGDLLSIDFLSEVCAGGAASFCAARAKRMLEVDPQLTFDGFLRGLLLPQVAHVVLKYCGVEGSSLFERAQLGDLVTALSDFCLTVRGIGDESNCQVQRGGYPIERIDPATMAQVGLPGLYFAGETLDVDGPCGGYNLHWAWASGMLAGASAVHAL